MDDGSAPVLGVVDGDASVDRPAKTSLMDARVTGSRAGGSWAGWRALPWAGTLVLAMLSLLRSGVLPDEIVRFSLYWLLALLAPGFVVFRSVFDRPSVAENLIGAGVTGLALEIAMWHLLRTIGLDQLVSWWWLPVLIVFAAVPALRTRWLRRHRSALPWWWHWLLAALICLAFMGLDIGGFRPNPLPPANGVIYVDLWWHLAMVQELMRSAPAQVPQIAGEALEYHLNSHAHMAVASQTAGINPEVVLFRLWIFPMVALTLGSVALVAHRLSGALWSGPVAVWLTSTVLAGGFIWPNNLGGTASSPIVFLSPSQVLANVFMVASLGLLIEIVRGRGTRWHLAALALTAWVGIGAKPTVGALLFAGVVAASASALVFGRHRPNRHTVIAGATLGVFVAWSLIGQNSGGSRFTVLGSLRDNRVYQRLNPNDGIRAVNDGLLLDSIDSGRAVFAAVVTLVVLLGYQSVRLIGFGVLMRKRTRRDPAGWLLAGSVGAGWLAFLVLDHVGYSQAYFLHTAIPAGAMLTAWLLVDATGGLPAQQVVPIAAAGFGVGVIAAPVATGAAERVASLPGGGTLDTVAVPLVVMGAVVVGVAIVWRRLRAHGAVAPLGLMLAIMITIGVTSAPAMPAIAGRVVEFAWTPSPSVDPTAVGFVSAGELEAARWLRSNSNEDDVVATNLHCRPPTNAPVYCDARGYWLGGQSGRRVVLEGWAYTSAAQELQGVGGRSFARQPSPWPERYELSNAAVVEPTAEVLDRLVSEYGASWLVAVRRADAISPTLFALADLAFDNGEVAIFRLG